MLPGTHRNRELAGALTCRNLLILGPPTSITPELVMSLPRIVRSQQPHRTLAKNSNASGVTRAEASTMKMHSPRFGTQTVLPGLLSQPGRCSKYCELSRLCLLEYFQQGEPRKENWSLEEVVANARMMDSPVALHLLQFLFYLVPWLDIVHGWWCGLFGELWSFGISGSCSTCSVRV